MDAASVIVLGSPSFHRIPLVEILSSRGMRVVQEESAGAALGDLVGPDSGVRALFLDLTQRSAERRALPAALPRDKGVVVFGIINPLTTTSGEAIEAGCHQACSVFDTPEEVLEKLLHALFGGADSRRNPRVVGYWPAGLGAGGPRVPCRAVALSREGAFLQTDWAPADRDAPLEASIHAVPGRPFRAASRVLYQVPWTGPIVLGGLGIRFLEGFGEAESIVETLSTNGSAGPVPTIAQGRPSLLVADDDPNIRTLIARVFEREGWEVVGVGDGSEAVERASGRAFDAVLMDIEMGGMNGVDALKRIRPLLPGTSFALMTGGGARVQGMIREAEAEGGEIEVLTKPFALADLEGLFPKLH